MNKYGVDVTREKYVNCLNDNTPVKSYTPQRSPAVKKAIEAELEKLEKADFMKPSISPYSALTVSIKKLDDSLRVNIDLGW